MLSAQVQFTSWGKIYSFSVGELKLATGDEVIVATGLGLELGKILDIVEEQATSVNQSPIVRKVSAKDRTQIPGNTQKRETLNFCQELIIKHQLPMKLIDVYTSWESGRLDFAFTADQRIDFRDLVKDLSGHFNVAIRLTQIGTRDEAKILGDCGSCGRTLCCQGCLREFCSITSEMAEVQQVVNRGSDRISGMCGRLKCCLSFEYQDYKVLVGELPPCGTKVNVDGLRGVVIQQHVLKQTVDVRVLSKKSDERPTIIEVDINRHGKKF